MTEYNQLEVTGRTQTPPRRSTHVQVTHSTLHLCDMISVMPCIHLLSYVCLTLLSSTVMHFIEIWLTVYCLNIFLYYSNNVLFIHRCIYFLKTSLAFISTLSWSSRVSSAAGCEVIKAEKSSVLWFSHNFFYSLHLAHSSLGHLVLKDHDA